MRLKFGICKEYWACEDTIIKYTFLSKLFSGLFFFCHLRRLIQPSASMPYYTYWSSASLTLHLIPSLSPTFNFTFSFHSSSSNRMKYGNARWSQHSLPDYHVWLNLFWTQTHLMIYSNRNRRLGSVYPVWQAMKFKLCSFGVCSASPLMIISCFKVLFGSQYSQITIKD